MSTASPVYYAIFLDKVEGRELSKEIISQHIDHLAQLDREEKLVLCGPFSDHPSGMVIVKAKDKHEATAIAKIDPFVREGVRSYHVRTWIIACKENHYLA